MSTASCDRRHGHERHCCNGVVVVVPDDIIAHEILVRLPVRSILRLRCVSKSWYALFSSPAFVDSHLQHSKKQTPTLLITSLRHKRSPITMHSYSHYLRPRHARFIFSKELPNSVRFFWSPVHSNGLVLVNNSAEMIVCNPSTRECRTLPKGSSNARIWPEPEGHIGMNRTGFGFVSTTKTYKLGQYFYRSFDPAAGTWSMGFEVFTLGVDSQWRAAKQELLYPPNGSPSMSVGESIYFKIDRKLYTTLPPSVFYFSFDLADESFRTVCVPSDLPGDCTQLGFAQLGRDTCFNALSNADSKLNTWVNGKDKNSWVRVFSIDLRRPTRSLYPVARGRDGSLLVLTWKDRQYKLECYGPRSSLWKTAEEGVDLGEGLAYYFPQKCSLTWLQGSVFHVSSYVESLLPTK